MRFKASWCAATPPLHAADAVHLCEALHLSPPPFAIVVRHQGMPVIIRLQSGESYDGILCTGWWDSECPADAAGDSAGVVMKVVRRIVGPEELVQKDSGRCVFKRADFVSLVAKDADLYNDERTLVARSIGDGVLADTEIEVAGRGAGEDRELVAATSWLGEESAIGGLDAGGKTQRGWDQFAVNERLGARSTYSDDLYTTKLTMDKYTPAQLAAAARMAKEIEKGETTNTHILEERGLKELDDNDDEDEEAKYSMVMTTDGADASRAAATPNAATTPSGGPPPPPSGPPPASASVAQPPLPSGAPPTPAGAPTTADAAAPGTTTPKAAPLVAMRSKLSASAKSFVPGAGGWGGAKAPPAPGASGADASPPVPPQPPNMFGSYGSPQGGMMQGGMMAGSGGMYPPGGGGVPNQMAGGMAMQMGGAYPMGMAPAGMMSPKTSMSPQQQQMAAQQMAQHQMQQQQMMQQQQQRIGMGMGMAPPPPGGGPMMMMPNGQMGYPQQMMQPGQMGQRPMQPGAMQPGQMPQQMRFPMSGAPQQQGMPRPS